MGRGKIKRNCLGPVPHVDAEGVFVKSIPLPPKTCNDDSGMWYDGMSPFDRVFYHQTENSALRFVGFKQNQ